jgi:hypothetical protein
VERQGTAVATTECFVPCGTKVGSGGAAAAGFEFFAGAAGAGVVAADFGEFALEGEFELGCGRLVGGGGGGLTGRCGFGI